MQHSTVAPERGDVTEADFRLAMALGLSRAEKNAGSRKKLAEAMDLSTKQIGNIIEKGATTDPKRLFDARRACPMALDNVAELYGMRFVSKEAVCDTDDFTVLLAKAMVWLREAEHPDSPGGRAIVHTELFNGEHTIRQLHKLSGDLIGRINALRENAA